PPERQELFGWVVREGITNVVRHSGARTCTVRVGAEGVEVRDDGAGGTGSAGSGLTGLAERVAAAGGSLDAAPAEGGGFRLLARVPADARRRGDGSAPAE